MSETDFEPLLYLLVVLHWGMVQTIQKGERPLFALKIVLGGSVAECTFQRGYLHLQYARL